jgi:hypothetical protein
MGRPSEPTHRLIFAYEVRHLSTSIPRDNESRSLDLLGGYTVALAIALTSELALAG